MTWYGAWFSDSFPYLHYVDPPYDMKRIVKTIETSSSAHKYIILGNNIHYIPLFQYSFLFSKINPETPIVLLDSFNSQKKLNELLPEKKKNEDIFFVKFGDSTEKEGAEFLKINVQLQCNLKEITIPYVYFAKCE